MGLGAIIALAAGHEINLLLSDGFSSMLLYVHRSACDIHSFFCNSDSISLAVYTVSRSCAFSAWLSCTNSQSAKWTPPAAHYWSSWEWGLLSKKLIISCTFPPIFILFFKKMSATAKLTEQWEWDWEELSPHFFPIFNLIWITSNVLCSYKKSKWTNY